MNFIQRSLMARLMILFLTVSLLTVVCIGYTTYRTGRAVLEKTSSNKLKANMEMKRKQVKSYLNSIVDVLIIRSDRNFRKAYEPLKVYHTYGEVNADGNLKTGIPAYEEVYTKIDYYFRKFVEVYKLKDMYFICASHGHVLYSSSRGKDLGTNLKTGPYKDSGLGKLWEKVMEDKKLVMIDYSYYEPAGEMSLFLGLPAFKENNEIYGVIAIRLTPDEINSLLQSREGMGNTEVTYFMGSDYLKRSNTRLDTGITVMKVKNEGLEKKNVFDLKEGLEIVRNSHGEDVLTSFQKLGLNEQFGIDFDWMIVSEITMKETLEPVRELELNIVKIAIVLIILIILLVYYIAKNISDPVKEVAGEITKFGKGDLTVHIKSGKRQDEIGVLEHEFASMVELFRKQIEQILEGTTVLSVAVSQISAATAELSSTATETAASVSETTATIEELRQTSELSSQKAKQLSAGAQKTAAISQQGKKSTEDTIEEIKKIKEHMESIAETIVKLSEQGQSIGEIIATVNDLAEQSNILAVNAAIEAVKAGEAGKGFSVVAQEVRSLAEQSKEATGQIRHILNDIQKATTAAVMAAEHGIKAVELGVKQSSRAGEAIVTLSNSVLEAAQSSIQIEASSHQQLAGIEQVNMAMKNIKEASMQNVESARQLEDATKSIGELWGKLKDLIKIYKL